MPAEPLIGLLALQGDFVEHHEALKRIGVAAREVRLPSDLDGCDALIFPGGESTTILKLLKLYNLYDLLIEKGKSGLPMYGTCAGTIVLSTDADRLDNPPLGLIDISVKRNAYGRQIDSFEESLTVKGIDENVPGIFIRAPKISRVGKHVEILSVSKEGEPVIARENNILVSTFHPELSESSAVHRFFVNTIVRRTMREGNLVR